jgi:hypothetical protein
MEMKNPQAGVEVLTAQEQEAAFQAARDLVEEITPILDSKSPHVSAMTLQLLVAREGVRLGKTPEEVLKVLAVNVPQLMVMLEKAYAEAEADYETQQQQKS